MSLLTAGVVAALASLAGTGASRPLLIRAGFMDIPNERSSHVDATPRAGGVAPLLVLCVALLVWSAQRSLDSGWLVLGTLLLAATGLVDDARSLSAKVRLAAQLLAGAVVAVSVFGVDSVGAAGLALAGAVWVAAFVNAFNFMDGINGISGVTAALGGLWYWLMGAEHGGGGLVAAGGCFLAASAVGFLPWNFPRALLFLGDVGSYGLGVVLASLAILSYKEGVPVLWCVAPCLLYALDTGRTLMARASRHAPLMTAHREHVYQRITDARGQRAALGVVVITSLAILGAAWVSLEADSVLGRSTGFVALAVVLGCYALIPTFALRRES